MSKTLDEIRKKLQALDTRKGGASGSGSGDKSVYPHWNIPEGTSATLRLLPDGNEENTFFWAERLIFKFPFPGIKGQDENKPVVVQVPCIEMWDGKMSCPVLNEVRPWWKDESLKKVASTYWTKKTYYMQGFVRQDPMNETDTPENPIRKLIMGPQIFAIVKAALLDPDMLNSPVDYVSGTDFIVNKTSKGGFADYGTSKWARRESSLTDEEMAAIEKHKLVDLSSYLPKKPTPEQLAIIYEMFQASLDGELYDPAKWSMHYKPFGFDSSSHDDDGEGAKPVRNVPVPRAVVPTVTPVKVAAPIVLEDDDVLGGDVVEDTKVEVKETATATAGKSPQEILAMLRNRNK